MRAPLAICLAGLLAAGCRARQGRDDVVRGKLTIDPQDRILILAPHPDDEAIGCAGIIEKAVEGNLPLQIVFLTNGDNNQWSFVLYRKRVVLAPSAVRNMGLKRRDEAIAAAASLGVASNALVFLGYPDMGTLAVWNTHWAAEPPFRSMLTRAISVPYGCALRPGAPYKGEEILRDLTAIIRDFRPTKIFVSHPADHNPDHRALYLFTRVALWDLDGELRPEVHPYLVHFKRWPRPRGYRPWTSLTPPESLHDEVRWSSSPLGPVDELRKTEALKAHHTQYLYSAAYLSSFVRRNELFGDFPDLVLSNAVAGLSVALEDEAAGDAESASAEMSEEERSAFTGIEWHSVRVDGRDLVIAVNLSRPLAKAVETSFYAFGYRAEKPFALQPKLCARIGVLEQSLYDQSRRIAPGDWSISRSATRIVVRLPLKLLGKPDRILVSAQTHLGDIPLDWAAWRTVRLPMNRVARAATDSY